MFSDCGQLIQLGSRVSKRWLDKGLEFTCRQGWPYWIYAWELYKAKALSGPSASIYQDIIFIFWKSSELTNHKHRIKSSSWNQRILWNMIANLLAIMLIMIIIPWTWVNEKILLHKLKNISKKIRLKSFIN